MSTSTPKTALITGLRGQDGSFLAEHLIAQGYRVIGTSHVAGSNFRLPELGIEVEVEKLDLSSTQNVKRVIDKVRPDEVYNFAARSSSAQLFDDPLRRPRSTGWPQCASWRPSAKFHPAPVSVRRPAVSYLRVQTSPHRTKARLIVL